MRCFRRAGCNACRVRGFVTLSGLPVQSRAMKIGYGRVSTRDQNPDARRDALAAAGCDQVFTGKASGKLARRPELDRAPLVARAGDQLVVTKLDRLGRSLEHLIGLAKDLQARSIDLVVLDQGGAGNARERNDHGGAAVRGAGVRRGAVANRPG
jgi:predicted site-specific integrase-resolvase